MALLDIRGLEVTFATGKQRLNAYFAQFFLCHLAQEPAACALIYGDADDSVCHAYGAHTKGLCEIKDRP